MSKDTSHAKIGEKGTILKQAKDTIFYMVQSLSKQRELGQTRNMMNTQTKTVFNNLKLCNSALNKMAETISSLFKTTIQESILPYNE